MVFAVFCDFCVFGGLLLRGGGKMGFFYHKGTKVLRISRIKSKIFDADVLADGGSLIKIIF